MNIAIDIRCLMEREPTGVGEYTLNLLRAIFAQDKNNQYLLFYNSAEDVSNVLPVFNEQGTTPFARAPGKPNVRLCGFAYPNKLFNFSLKFFGRLSAIFTKAWGTMVEVLLFKCWHVKASEFKSSHRRGQSNFSVAIDRIYQAYCLSQDSRAKK